VTFLEKMRAQLVERLAQRAALQTELEAIVAVPTAEARDLNEAELGTFTEKRTAIVAEDGVIAELRDKISNAETIDADLEEMRAAATAAGALATTMSGPRVNVRSEELTYREGGQASYFRDLAMAQAPGVWDSEARGRLQRHATEMDIEVRTNMSRTDGQGGEFVPPLWLMDKFVALARAGRVTADLCMPIALPGGTDSINLPTIATGATVTGTADNTSISNTDITTGSVAIPVNTYSGQQLFALSLLEQSPLNMDVVVFQDLLAAHAQKIGDAVINGAGTTALHKGILTNTATNSITYTATTPTGAGVYTAIGQAVSNVARQRYLPPEAIVMTPQRWYWLCVQVDTNGRPLVLPGENGPWNTFGVQSDVVAQGAVGSMLGLPVYLDPNIPTTASTDQDRVIVARFSDLVLLEGALRTRVLYETDADKLQVRLQVYNYSGFTSYRYSKAISVCSGTGFVSPSGY
jgi:HK97 family phage major capsid protein